MFFKDSDLIISRKFSNTTFYIDTPLVLGAIGLDYDDRCQKSLELINMIKKLDGKVFIFDQTLDEISYIIRGIIKNYSSPVYPSSAHRTALSKKMSISDLKMLLERVDKKILGTGIKIRPRINVHDNRKSLIDESLLEAEIRETVGQINDHAIKHDTYCIRDIHILRRDTKPKHIEDAIAVFVTSNTKLATASYNFALINIPETKASAVVTDFYLTNRCFLKLPLDTSSISRIELYSICLSVLRPSDAMWVKYVRELNKLHDDDYIDQDLYMHMRLHTEETENELLDIVYEHGGHFSQNDIIELTERLRNKFTKDIELERDNLAAKVNTITSNIDKTAKRIARIVISALSIITLVLLSITAYTYFTSQQSNTNNFITYMSATGNFLLLVFTAFGVSVTSLLLTVRNKTVEWIKIKLQS